MKSLRRILRQAFDKGIVLALGLGCLLLYKQHYLPNVLGPLSYGMISVGAIGFTRYIIMHFDAAIEKAEYQKILRILDERKLEIQENREKLEELRQACERFMAMREILEGCRKDPSLVQEKITILEQLLRIQENGTSVNATKGSTQNTISNMPTTQCSSSESRKETETGFTIAREDERGETPKNLHHGQQEEILEKIREVPPEILQVEIFEKVLQETLQELTEEVSENVIDEEAEKVWEMISEDIQKEISERMQAELPENLQDMSEKSLEEIMEKVQKDILEKVQKEAIEGIQEDIYQNGQQGISTNVQKQISKMRQEKVFEKGHEEIPEKEQEKIAMNEVKISRKQLEEVSKTMFGNGTRNLKDNKFSEMLESKTEQLDNKHKKPQEENSEKPLVGMQSRELEKQENLSDS